MNNSIDINTESQNHLSLSEIIFIIRKRALLILSITLLTVLFSFLYIFIQIPTYESKALIMIEDPSSSSGIFEMGMGVEKNYLQNEIEILKSRTTSEKAVNSLFNSKHKNNLFIFGTRDFKPNFLRDIFSLNDKKNQFSNQKELNDSLLIVFTKRMQNDMVISNYRNTDMIELAYTTCDPFEASLIANTIIEEYKKIDLEWATGEMSHLKYFLIDQIEKKENEMINSENSLEAFQKKKNYLVWMISLICY